MASEYLDMGYIVWRAMQESAGHGWGLVIDPGNPPPSGDLPASFGARGQSLSSLVETLGTRGQANGVRATATDDGYMRVTVGPPAWEQYDGVMVDPLNVRELSASSPGRADASVTVEGGGDFATASDAGARFPGRQIIAGDGPMLKTRAQAVLDSGKRTPGTISLEADGSLADLRVGDVVPYIRAGNGAESLYVRVVSIAVDEAATETFGLTVQVIEPNALTPTTMTTGAYWPGVRGTGSALVRRFQAG